MPYCIRCGVKLEETASGCPLCSTPVPEEFRSPAEDASQTEELSETWEVRVPSRAAAGIITLLLCIPFGITLATDLAMNGSISWSYYSMIVIAFSWLVLIQPFVTPRRIGQLIIRDLLAAAAFLILIDMRSAPIAWAWYPAASLASLALIIMIFRNSRNGYIRIILTSAVVQAFLMVLEGLHGPSDLMTWSVTFALPLVLCTAAGALLICFFLRRAAAHPAWSVGLFTLSMSLLLAAGLLILLDLVLVMHDQTRSGGWSLAGAVPLILLAFAALHGAKQPRIHQALRRRFHL